MSASDLRLTSHPHPPSPSVPCFTPRKVRPLRRSSLRQLLGAESKNSRKVFLALHLPCPGLSEALQRHIEGLVLLGLVVFIVYN
jgi:hypothetical protein